MRTHILNLFSTSFVIGMKSGFAGIIIGVKALANYNLIPNRE